MIRLDSARSAVEQRPAEDLLDLLNHARHVDARLKVRGVPGLRIADASVMPTMSSADTNAPSIAIGEKAVDLILEDAAR